VGDSVNQAFVFKTEPYAHQLTALEKSCDLENYAYFMEMGTGKSKVLIDNLSHLYTKGKINAVVIVAPKGVYRNWAQREIPIHLPDFIEKKMYLWTPGESASIVKEREELLKPSQELKILVMNVEALSTIKGVKFAWKFIANHDTLMAVDESTTIKNPGAKRTKNIIKIGKYCHYRRILTGSPVTRSPMDVYTQSQFLDPALLGFSSYYSFRNRYALLVDKHAGGRSFKQVVGYQNLEELNKLLQNFSYRVLKEDCLDLPDKVYTKREIEMSPEQKKVYKEIQKYAISELSSIGTVSASSVITQIIRLHQISCGFVSTDEGVVKDIPNSRTDELMQILTETEGKAIIWANYRHDIKRLQTMIAKEYGEESVGTYFGDTSDADRESLIIKFQDKDNPLRFFIGNTQTGGYGITLTAANTVIYFSNNYDLEKRLQSEDRAHRIGQTNKVTYIDIVCKDTVDEKIVKALRSKLNLAQTVLGEDAWENWL
jgi:SNF2 family DNA or RNA helicase